MWEEAVERMYHFTLKNGIDATEYYDSPYNKYYYKQRMSEEKTIIDLPIIFPFADIQNAHIIAHIDTNELYFIGKPPSFQYDFYIVLPIKHYKDYLMNLYLSSSDNEQLRKVFYDYAVHEYQSIARMKLMYSAYKINAKGCLKQSYGISEFQKTPSFRNTTVQEINQVLNEYFF